ncbi:PAS domain-containing protein [Limisalsivibrio acetivorans]|uniref:PAS domain-containing protein n=1 Tax=Limisalsivibrio acetivorans TaxID=1304888 RepID=UPI0003B643EC|nr:PAS domain-containing protein [Limisalsivibrio acetivorans]
MPFDALKVRKKVFNTVAVILFLMLFLLTALEFYAEKSEMDSLRMNMSKQVRYAFNAEMRRVSKHYFYRIDTLLEGGKTAEALNNNNRQRLISLVSDDFEILRKENPYLELLHFQDSQNRSVLRMHKIDKFGDNLTDVRPLVADTNRLKAPLHGFELGKYGFYYRVSKPVFTNDGEHAGSVEFGIKLCYFFDILREIMPETTPVAVLSGIESASFPGLERGIIHNNKLIFSPDNNLGISAADASADDGYFLDNTTGKFIHAEVTDITDYKGRKIGELHAVRDATPMFNWSSVVLILMFVGGLGVCFTVLFMMNYGFAYFLRKLNRSKQDLDNLYELFNEGDTVIIKWKNNEYWDVEYATENIRRIFGYSRDSFLRNEIRYGDVIHPDDIDRVTDEVGEALRDNLAFFNHEPYRVLCPEGNYIWVHDSTKLIKNSRGVVTHFLGYLKNISEFINNNIELNEIRERYKLAAEGSNDGIWDWNVKNGEVYFSPRWKEMLGYNDEDIPHHVDSWANLIHPEDIDHVMSEVRRMLEGEIDFYETEHRVMAKDGSYRWILDRGKAFFDENGRPYRAVGFHTDITDKKTLELELESQRRFLQTLLENLPVPVYYKDTELNYIGCNDRFAEFSGIPKEDIIGKNAYDIVPPEQAELVHSRDEDALENPGELQIYESNINPIHCEEDVSVIFYKEAYRDASGEVAGIIGTIMDITQTKDLQRTLINSVFEMEVAKKNMDEAQRIARIGSWTWDFETGAVTWSDENYRILDIEIREVEPGFDVMMSFIHPEDRRAVKEEAEASVKERRRYSIDHRIVRRDGTIRIVEGRGELVYGEDNEPVSMIGTIQDVTELRNAQNELSDLNSRLMEYTEIVDEYVITFRTSSEGVLDYVSNALCRISGYDRKELIGKHHRVLKHPDMDEESYSKIWATLKGGKVWHGELKQMCKNGSEYWVKTSISPTFDRNEQINGFTAISQDITDKKKIEVLSVTDRLTRIYNRIRLDEVFRNEIVRSERYGTIFSIIILDIDKFKNVNDTYGHQTGDEVLKRTAELLLNNIRSADTVGRWGGEEFLIICPETDINGAKELAEKLRLVIAEEDFGEAGTITCSFGATQYIEGSTENIMMKYADEALYKAKRSGRNRTEAIPVPPSEVK